MSIVLQSRVPKIPLANAIRFYRRQGFIPKTKSDLIAQIIKDFGAACAEQLEEDAITNSHDADVTIISVMASLFKIKISNNPETPTKEADEKEDMLKDAEEALSDPKVQEEVNRRMNDE